MGADIIESLLDPSVIDALVKAWGTNSASIVESRLDNKFKELFESLAALKSDNARSQKSITVLEKENILFKSRLEDLEVI